MNLRGWIRRRLSAFTDKEGHLKATVIYLGIRLPTMILSWVFFWVIARFFGPQLLGEYTLAIGTLTCSLIFANFGSGPLTIRYLSPCRGDPKGERTVLRRILASVFPVTLLVSAILFMAAPVIAERGVREPILTQPLRWLALGLPVLVAHTFAWNALMAVQRTVAGMIVYLLLPAFLKLVAITPLLFMVLPALPLLIAGHLASYTVAVLVAMLIWSRRQVSMKSEPVKHFPEQIGAMTNLWQTALPFTLSGAMHFLLHWTDSFMLGNIIGSEAVGLYRPAVRYSSLNMIVFFGVMQSCRPRIAQFHALGDNLSLRIVSQTASRFILLTTTPVFLALTIFHGFWLSIMGAEYHVAETAMLLLNLGAFFNALSGMTGVLLNMTGHEKLCSSLYIVGTIANIGLNALLIPHWQLAGAATATAFSTILYNTAALVAVKHHLGFITGFVFLRPRNHERA